MKKDYRTKSVARWGRARSRLAQVVGLLAGIGSAAALAATSATPALAAPAPPTATISRYMQTVDARMPNIDGVRGVLYNEGCSMGSQAISGLVVLAFGGTGWVGTSTYGTWNWNGQFYNTSQIEAAGRAFLTGYWDCSPSYPQITLALGASNSGNGDSYGHGAAWAAMVHTVQNWINANSYQSQEWAQGAMDFEPGFGTAPQARSWVSGYNSTYHLAYFNFGSADGCFQGRQTDGTNHGCNPGWTQDDEYYLSWGAPPAWSVPEIYRTDGAQATQWENIALYGHYRYNSAIGFSGEMTQLGACQTHGCNSTLNNAPATGWNQLWNATASSGYTSYQPYFKWSTDITWAN